MKLYDKIRVASFSIFVISLISINFPLLKQSIYTWFLTILIIVSGLGIVYSVTWPIGKSAEKDLKKAGWEKLSGLQSLLITLIIFDVLGATLILKQIMGWKSGYLLIAVFGIMVSLIR